MKLGEWLRAQHMTQVELAARMSVSQSTVSRWLAGEKTPSVRRLKRLAVLTHGAVTLDDFDEPPPKAAQVAA